MYALLVLIIITVAVIFWPEVKDQTDLQPSRIELQLNKLWDISLGAIHDKKYVRAEKALLTILRVDDRNARAYNRLGILYAKQGQYKDAIECFEITQSLAPSASALHNVGLICYEVGQYDKAAQAFEQALSKESDVASRHVAYAKVLEKMGNNKKMLEELKTAVNLERNPQSLGLLADALDRNDEHEQAEKVRLLMEKTRKLGNRSRIKQPRKVIM